MGIGYRIKEARENLGLTQTELGNIVGVTGSAITNYEKETSHPKEQIIYKLMEVLNVDTNYLFQDAVKLPEKKNDVTLSEYNMIKRYRGLDQYGQDTVSYILNREAERVKQIEQATTTVIETADSDSVGRILQYFHSVSAGAGEVIFDDVYSERITVPNRPQYHRVAYAVKVNGHSMEPLYHDKDILLVEPACEVNVNEIGIFNVNGQAYVKKLGKGKLISLNKGYDDIPLKEESLCMGRVVDSLKS